MAKYRDRKINRGFTFVGSDVYADGTARGQSKNMYEPGSNIVNNWDVFEGVLDYVFIKMGIDGKNGNIDRPIVMTEPLANLQSTRKCIGKFTFFWSSTMLIKIRQTPPRSSLNAMAPRLWPMA